MDVDKIVKLLGQTDGRDKIYKTLNGVCKVLAFQAADDKSAVKKWNAMSKSIGEGRSLMRMGKWVGNYAKLQGFAAKLGNLSQYQLLEIIRVIGDFGYVVGDNLQYLAKYGLVPLDAKKTAKNSKVFQFWGYVCALLLDLWSLAVLGAKKLEPAAYRKQRKQLLLSIVKNAADVANGLNNVGYAAPYGYAPNGMATGMFGVTSGGIATYLNWQKLSK